MMTFRQVIPGIAFGSGTSCATVVQLSAHSTFLVQSAALSYRRRSHTVVLEDGQVVSVLPTYMGAETRFEDYVYLQLMEREWGHVTRGAPPENNLRFASEVSMGASLVLLFWTYFETRLEYLLRRGLRHAPPALLQDALNRHSTVGARLKSFYKVAFGSTYHKDLISLGYSDVSTHLANVQKHRNEFAHGSPRSIDDALVKSVVEMLKREHEAWIAVYNYRVPSPRTN